MTHKLDPDLLTFLASFLTPERAHRIETVLAMRTRYLTVVLEDLYQAQNVSAVIRSCECMGIQDVHIIERIHYFQSYKDITKGADKWLNLNYFRGDDSHSNTQNAISKLQLEGYAIVACGPHVSNEYAPENLPINKPIALCFGSEKMGLTKAMISQADYHLKIPMCGFTESYNISVAAAMTLYTLTQRIRTSDYSWALKADEAMQLKYQWIKQSLRMADQIEEQWAKKTRPAY